jgi:hypothetical protein
MDTPLNAARRSEDIALDLLKLVAAHTTLGNKSASPTPGFAPPAGARAEDQVAQILDLYARCREAVDAPIASTGSKK